jgi:hypothetical protein
MNKPISRKAHGLADLTYIPLTALSPELLNFKSDSKASTLARVLGGAMLGSALLTRSEWGLFKVLPFKAHLAADAGIGLFSLAAPWLLKFSKNTAARNTFLFVGLSGLIIGGLLTQRNEMQAR